MEEKKYIYEEGHTSDLLCESQLSLLYSSMQERVREDSKYKILSLFSGCGGMDLGFEGGFMAPYKSVSMRPDWIKEYINDDWVLLRPTNYKMVFANDILKEAALTWTHHMKKYGYSPFIYHTESIVDLVKQHEAGHELFPKDIDVVIGGFPCQDFSVAGKRKGVNSLRSHDGKKRSEELPSEENRGILYYWM